jgi:hypothetical protein
MIDAMVSTSSSEMRWVDGDKIIGLKRPPSIAEREDASCGSFTSKEWDAYSALAVKQIDRRSPQEQMFLKLLAEKLDKHNGCISSLLSAQRDRLVSP